MGSVRSCQKLPSCPTESMPVDSKTNSLLANVGNTSGRTNGKKIRKGEKSCDKMEQPEKRSENT